MAFEDLKSQLKVSQSPADVSYHRTFPVKMKYISLFRVTFLKGAHESRIGGEIYRIYREFSKRSFSIHAVLFYAMLYRVSIIRREIKTWSGII